MTENKFSTIERVLAGAGIAAAMTGTFIVTRFNPTTAGFFPVCPLYSMTGILCPGCGLTRGFHALLHGEVLTALQFNALLPVYLLFFVYLLAALVFYMSPRSRSQISCFFFCGNLEFFDNRARFHSLP